MNRALSALAVGLCLSCTGDLEPGEYGTLRFVGRVNGETPLRLVPPIADLDGNVYTAFGSLDRPGTTVFVSANGGGQGPSCELTKGDVGLHGFVGFSDDRAYYWSGDGLFVVTPRACEAILDTDPNSNANVFFRGVVPYVFDSASRRTVVALAFTQDEPPSFVRVDLDRKIFTDVLPFPGEARDLVVLGTGANREERIGVVVVQYLRGDALASEALYLDETATVVARVGLPLPQLPPYAIAGNLAVSASGLALGVFGDGQLLSFDRSSARVGAVAGMTAIGAHAWKGALYVVGTARGRPVAAAVADDGSVGPPLLFESSERAATQTEATIYDDRSPPARDISWSGVRTALGPFPFVSAYNPAPYADDLTLWVVAGPVVDAGQTKRTAIAVGPVGIEYP